MKAQTLGQALNTLGETPALMMALMNLADTALERGDVAGAGDY